MWKRLEKSWERSAFAYSLAIGFAVGLLYYFKLLVNIRDVLSNVIAFASIAIGLAGVFLSLLVSIQNSDAFKHLKQRMPNFEKRLYTLLRKQVLSGLIVVIISLFISMLPPSPNKIVSSVGVTVWSIFFVLMSGGIIFSVKLIIDLIIGTTAFEQTKIQKRK
ncbi:hypothetical protein [Terribacillus saccharophilus]|uniref:hypothetical protein n=1 Tax=Terribacillus saccharophilus TaxID=361277 RepID=UPI000C9B29CB|nr:hypothetical protein [Terribacillus goriensis]